MRGNWSVSAPVAILLAMMSWADLLGPFVEKASKEGAKGGERYEAGDWAGAKKHFEDAALARPDGTFDYNRGAASYREGKFQEAAEAYGAPEASRAVAPDRVAYDLGNARFRLGDYAGAVEAYRAALRDNPAAEDARANYELARRLLARNPQAPPDPRSSGQDERPQEQQSSPPDSSRGGEDDKEEGRPSQGEPRQPQDGGAPKEPRDAPASPGQESKAKEGEASAPTEMSPAEAKQLLNAVTPEERELLQARLKTARKKRAEKDW